MAASSEEGADVEEKPKKVNKQTERLKEELAKVQEALNEANNKLTAVNTENSAFRKRESELQGQLMTANDENLKLADELEKQKLNHNQFAEETNETIAALRKSLEEGKQKYSEMVKDSENVQSYLQKDLEKAEFEKERLNELRDKQMSLFASEKFSFNKELGLLRLQKKQLIRGGKQERTFFSKLILSLAGKLLIRNHRMRRRLCAIHKTISRWLCDRMAESNWNKTKKQREEMVAEAWSEKQRELARFMTTQVSPYEVFNSLEVDLENLVEPMNGLAQQIHKLHETVNSFSKTNVELRGVINERNFKIVELQDQIQHLKHDIEDVRHQLHRANQIHGVPINEPTTSSKPVLKKFAGKKPPPVGSLIKLTGTGRWAGNLYAATVVEIRDLDNTIKVEYTGGGFKRFDMFEFFESLFTNDVQTAKAEPEPKVEQKPLRKVWEEQQPQDLWKNGKDMPSLFASTATQMMNSSTTQSKQLDVHKPQYARYYSQQIRQNTTRTNVSASIAASALLSPRYNRIVPNNRSAVNKFNGASTHRMRRNNKLDAPLSTSESREDDKLVGLVADLRAKVTKSSANSAVFIM